MNSGSGLVRGTIILSNSSRRYDIQYSHIHYLLLTMDWRADGRYGKIGDTIS